jgi:hypothetical protein
MLGPVPQKAELSIAAFPSADKRQDARLTLRHQLDNELGIGVEELHGLSKTSIAGHQFYYFETRRGIDEHAVYATDLDGYVVQIFTACRDPKLLQQLQSVVTHMRFFAPSAIAEFAGVGAEAYQGPAIPSYLLAQLKADPPAEKIEPGKVFGNIYQNRQLGFQYELPEGWRFGSQAAVMPALQRNRQQSAGASAIGPDEQLVLHSCERTLVSAWRKTPIQGGSEVLYEDFSEVTIYALSLACFPHAKFPDLTDSSAKESLREFVAEYGLSHPILREVKAARAFSREGRTYVVMDGIVAYHEDGDALSRRVSIALVLTAQRGYLLNFFFAAPHESELRELMNATAVFAPETQVQQAKAPASDATRPARADQPGASTEPAAQGGSPIATPAASPASPSGAVAESSSTVASKAPAPETAPAVQSAPPAAVAASDTESPSFHPTLLKPGETMQDQQGAPAKSPKK